MGISNAEIVKDAKTLTTTLVTDGLLNPEQARKFIKQTFDATNLRPLIRHEMRTARNGEIDKIGIASRILRPKVENTDDKYRVTPNFASIDYSTTAVKIPWEITEETLRENIEGEELESVIANLITNQMGIDLEDIDLNGDTDYATEDDSKPFLTINDGWIKQIKEGGHVMDRSGIDGGAMGLDVFYDTIKVMPNKYNNGKLRWIMSPHRYQDWIYKLLKAAVNNGGIITDNRIENPAAIPVVQCAGMPDDKILLVDPKNLIEVNTYNVKIRKTTEGESAIMQDKRFYVCHFDFDPIIEELDATAIITGLEEI